MDKKHAKAILAAYDNKDSHTEEDDFAFVEALRYLIDTENDDAAMVRLGGYYYDLQRFDLAERYYLMAFDAGNSWAPVGLGYIYYYGRTGERDYKKAYYYFSIAADKGDIESRMKLADMVRNGYGCEADLPRYRQMIESLYGEIKESENAFEPLPEIAHRYAEILIGENRTEEALAILNKARWHILVRIRYSPFWGNFIVMRRVVELTYRIIPFDEDEMTLYDLFFFFKKERSALFLYKDRTYEIASFFDEGRMRVKVGEKNYSSTEDFLLNHQFGGVPAYVIAYEDEYYLYAKEWD